MRRILLPLALAAPLAFAGPAAARDAHGHGPHISVTGEGEAAVAPDMAIVTLAVMREADTARAALDANNDAMSAVISAMKEQEIADRDLQTAGLSITPRYVYPENGSDEQPRIVAYQVTNTLTVRVRDLAAVGPVIDQSVTLGVNQGGDIRFTNDDPSAALTEARRAAVAEAMAKARTLAGAAGVELGDIVEISERNQTPPPMPYQAKTMRMEAAADAVPVEAGENTYNVHVDVVFEIEQ